MIIVIIVDNKINKFNNLDHFLSLNKIKLFINEFIIKIIYLYKLI